MAATIPILTHHIPHALVVLIMLYLITQEDTAATVIGSILGVVGVTIGLGLALLAWKISLDIPGCVSVWWDYFSSGSVPQDRS